MYVCPTSFAAPPSTTVAYANDSKVGKRRVVSLDGHFGRFVSFSDFAFAAS